MITIIHGEDIVKSRNYFIQEKTTHKDAVSLDGASMTLAESMQLFAGNTLFTTEKYIFIEDFFSKRKKSKETTEIINLITANQQEATIFFWEPKDLTPAQFKQFPGAINKQYKLPQTLFAFLDAVKPGNGQVLIQLFQQTLIDQDIQFLFVMLIRQFRLMLALSEQTDMPIEEVKRMAPWQKGKLQKQAGLFSLDMLKEQYQKLYQLEYGMKTGTLTMSPEQAIDFFLWEL